LWRNIDTTKEKNRQNSKGKGVVKPAQQKGKDRKVNKKKSRKLRTFWRREEKSQCWGAVWGAIKRLTKRTLGPHRLETLAESTKKKGRGNHGRKGGSYRKKLG